VDDFAPIGHAAERIPLDLGERIEPLRRRGTLPIRPVAAAPGRPHPLWDAKEGEGMPENAQDILDQLSAALSARVAAARGLVAGIAVRGHPHRSGTLWRKDVVVASEQALPDGGEAEIALAEGGTFAARIVGRDAGTNIAVLRFEGGPAPT